MKKILLIHTGGTIAMEENKATGGVNTKEIHPLEATIAELSDIAEITVKNYVNLPSPHITPSHMLELANFISVQTESDQYDGIVITHGTDTLEETAYVLDLVLQTSIPVIVTGAMRSSNEHGSDGPYNLISSVRVACEEQSLGKGVLVVFNDEIHAAKNVTKTHTSNIATFQSPQYGPIGIVTKRGVLFHHTPLKSSSFHVKKFSKNVILLKAYAGMDGSLIKAATNAADGVVIEALGQGNLPPATVPALQELIAKGVQVVLVSRCFNGIAQDIYSYEGGGKHLKELGAIFSNGLNGQKARLKLMIALENMSDPNQLQQLFLE
ncbi:L-asparaginase [Fictibacillus phosphorivorans]|uniref:asparaginase n=1 Tax=Fictibacillus phosphorivorans TaxID=1221500 RepID=A0A163R6M0_9BACL|nr:asparaginase [Fictibacillus phosphorivorans]KZE66269.1 L-asparaginase [Fictibacillus phosphorivorans]